MRFEDPTWDGPYFGEFSVLVDEAHEPTAEGLYSNLTGVRIRFSFEIDLKC